jgi:hypothetical protein
MSGADTTAPPAGQPDAPLPQTVDEAVAELARRYGERLPRLTDLIADSLLHDIWTLPIAVQKNPPAPLLFKACSTVALSVAPQLSGQVVVYVTDGADVVVTPCT